MEIKFGVGKYHIPKLQYCPQYLNMIGADSLSANQLKEKFYKAGCTYSFSVDEESFSMHLEGAEENLPEAVKLLYLFAHSAKPDDSKVKKLIDDLKAEHKISRREPSFIANALQEYVLYGKNSSFLRELSSKELNKLKGADLNEAFKQAQQYEITVNYVGWKHPDEVKNIFSENFKANENFKPRTSKIVLDRVVRKENAVFVCEKKDALQSQIYFNIEGKPLTLDEMPVADAFNNYFGGDMSSLVFQEIREFRSLAYSTHASFDAASVRGKNSHFWGYVGCQGDKTMDALAAMDSLIRFMPKKEERMNSIKSALLEKSQSRRPSFRTIIDKVEDWENLGYNDDPNKLKAEQYASLNFGNILNFYENEIKSKPITITIVGDKKRFNLKELEKYSKVEIVKEKDLFVN